ncbi:MAG: hypothetical protein K2I19_04380, partial [Muribaculaceae bacterium]|nr:hypothetical protein [Muribaculaceae bacterium]
MPEKISLPQRSDGTDAFIAPEIRQIVNIGANGAGKSRFANRLIDDLGQKAFRISALEALYGTRRQSAAPSVDSLFEQSGMQDQDGSQFERLLAMLMHDEMVNLIGYKLALAEHPDRARLRPTRLDRVISLWQEVLPGNRVLIESGKVLFARGLDNSAYSAVR